MEDEDINWEMFDQTIPIDNSTLEHTRHLFQSFDITEPTARITLPYKSSQRRLQGVQWNWTSHVRSVSTNKDLYALADVKRGFYSFVWKPKSSCLDVQVFLSCTSSLLSTSIHPFIFPDEMKLFGVSQKQSTHFLLLDFTSVASDMMDVLEMTSSATSSSKEPRVERSIEILQEGKIESVEIVNGNTATITGTNRQCCLYKFGINEQMFQTVMPQTKTNIDNEPLDQLRVRIEDSQWWWKTQNMLYVWDDRTSDPRSFLTCSMFRSFEICGNFVIVNRDNALEVWDIRKNERPILEEEQKSSVTLWSVENHRNRILISSENRICEWDIFQHPTNWHKLHSNVNFATYIRPSQWISIQDQTWYEP